MGKLSAQLIGDDPYFDGQSYVPSQDQQRLSGQLKAVRYVLLDNRWHTLGEIAQRVGGSEAGVSARLRDLRKPRFGSHTIEKERLTEGLWRYRLV